MPSDAKSPHCLWQGELKRILKCDTDVLLLKQLKLAKRLGKITGRLPLLFWH
jgi:hypothetical protein